MSEKPSTKKLIRNSQQYQKWRWKIFQLPLCDRAPHVPVEDF